MLLSQLDLLQQDPTTWVITLISAITSLVVAITIHEGSHAASAFMLGDKTAQHHGRLTLNPLKHLDPVGSLMILIVNFGWGKPTPVNPFNLTGGRKSMSIVALAGPVSNIILGFILALPIRLSLVTAYPSVFDFLVWMIFINSALAIFNMLPIPPLDGFRFALGVFPENALPLLAQVERFGPLALFGIIGLGFIGIPILSSLLYPPILFFVRMMVGT
tara:strand:+ start:1269 stop:1919 length:651 start_codon:yes stop_codon:yes gene_type:complete